MIVHMDIKELDKKQLVLLTLLITFVVSIATGIVTVSLMNQAPKSVPQTINNVIQRTIEKVTTVDNAVKQETDSTKTSSSNTFTGSGDTLVPIYSVSQSPTPVAEVSNNATTSNTQVETTPVAEKELGQGVIISDIGLVLVDSSILNESQIYKIILNKIDFDATVLKKFSNGFTILKISEKKTTPETPAKTDTTNIKQ